MHPTLIILARPQHKPLLPTSNHPIDKMQPSISAKSPKLLDRPPEVLAPPPHSASAQPTHLQLLPAFLGCLQPLLRQLLLARMERNDTLQQLKAHIPAQWYDIVW